MGEVKLQHLDDALHTILRDAIGGDFVECAPGRGGGAVYMRGFIEAAELADRRVWVADRFRSAPEGESTRSAAGPVHELIPDLNHVRDAFARFGVLDDRVRFLQGALAESFRDAPIAEIALLRFGAGCGAEAAVVLELLYDRLGEGGFVILEDTSSVACEAAVSEFVLAAGSPRRWRGSDGRDRHGARMWRRAALRLRCFRQARCEHRTPLAPPAPKDAIDLSVRRGLLQHAQGGGAHAALVVARVSARDR